jgi:ribosome-associated protein
MTQETSAKKDTQRLQRAIVDGLEDVKAQDIQVFNTEHLSPLFERVIVASGTSNRQTKALASSVRDKVREAGFPKPRIEGEDNGEWIIVDCGPAVAHIMQPAIRNYYHLEEIWGEKPIRLRTPGAAKAAPPRVAGGDGAGRKAAPARSASGPDGAARAAAKKGPAAKAGGAGKTAGGTAARSAGTSAGKPAKGSAGGTTAAGRKTAAKAPARAGAKTPAKSPAKAAGKSAAKSAAKTAARKTAGKSASSRKA